MVKYVSQYNTMNRQFGGPRYQTL